MRLLTESAFSSSLSRCLSLPSLSLLPSFSSLLPSSLLLLPARCRRRFWAAARDARLHVFLIRWAELFLLLPSSMRGPDLLREPDRCDVSCRLKEFVTYSDSFRFSATSRCASRGHAAARHCLMMLLFIQPELRHQISLHFFRFHAIFCLRHSRRLLLHYIFIAIVYYFHSFQDDIIDNIYFMY